MPSSDFTGLDDVRRRGRARARLRRRSARRRRSAGSDVTRNDQPLARFDLGSAGNAVGLHNCGCRHAVFARDHLDGFVIADGDGCAAIPSPMAARRRRLATRGHRAGHLSGVLLRTIGGKAAVAVGNAASTGDSRGPAWRRQWLRFDARAGGRTRRDRAGNFLARLRRRLTIVGGEGVGIKTRGVFTAGDSDADEGENCNARPGTQTSTQVGRHVEARHVVTHSYAKYVEFELNQPRVNKVLRITVSLIVVTSLIKMQHFAAQWLQFLRLSGQ